MTDPSEHGRGPTPTPHGATAPDASGMPGSRTRKSLTIGAVCKLLGREFPDISISKIRYLEDQKLLSPRRTQGGYRLYSQADVTRLRTILRLQRDEFLPLRVIRQELATGRATEDGDEASDRHETATRRLGLTRADDNGHDLEDVLDYSGADQRLVHEFEEFGLVKPTGRSGERRFDDIDREIIRLAGELTRYGVAARNLRVFRSSADREATLLEQVLGPALRSRNKDRKREAVEQLEGLAAVVSQLKHLLLVQDLRRLVD